MSTETSWSEARIELLKTLYEAGVSYGSIASEIGGVSRNAVIGKVHRLQLPSRPAEPTVSRPRRPRSSRSKRLVRKPPRSFDAPMTVDATDRVDNRCTIFHLKNESCRYPLWTTDALYGDHFYCGVLEADIAIGRSYCKHHTEICGPKKAAT